MTNSLRPLLQTALTLLVLAACAPNAQIPTATSPRNQQAAAPNQAGQSSQSSQTQAGAQGSAASSASAELQSQLTAVHEDEAIYNDSVAVAEGEAGFATQALGAARLDARLRVPGIQPAVSLTARQRRQQAAEALKLSQAERARFKAHLATSGAVTINADGTITIDPAAFKTQVKQQLQQRKERFQQHKAKLIARLELKRQILGERLQKLRHHDFIVRTSDKVSTTNADGSVTETVKISFENARLGIKRETVLAKTSLDGKLIRVEFELNEKTRAFTRTVTRVATHNSDGTKSVLIDAKTVWSNGRSHERHEERVVEADGSATGTGTLTLTKADGTVKTRTFTINLSARSEITTSSSDPDSDTEVIIEEEADGEATVIVTDEDGDESASEIDLEAEAEADASEDADGSPEASPSPSAEASPEASPSPEATSAPEVSPSPEATEEPATEASADAEVDA